jgi:hypothetical protein
VNKLIVDNFTLAALPVEIPASQLGR